MSDSDYILITESMPLKKERKGGAANLMLTALIIEAGRMLDEGFEREAVETAAVKAFGMDKGFLAVMESVGPDKALALMEHLSDDSDPGGSFFRIYNNFFSPPESLKKWMETTGVGDKKMPGTDESGEDVMEDFMLMDLLGRRFNPLRFGQAGRSSRWCKGQGQAKNRHKSENFFHFPTSSSAIYF